MKTIHSGIWAGLVIFGFVYGTGVGLASASEGASDTRSCGFSPDCCVYHASGAWGGAIKRGVNILGSAVQPARWANSNNVDVPPDRKTVVTYSIVTGGSSESKAGQTMNPIVDSEFIGAGTIDAIKEGVESWNDTCGITLTFVTSGAQIVVGAAAFPGGQVGLGGFTASGFGGKFAMDEGFVQLDNTDTWTAALLRAVAAHECGHALGINHSDLSAALMFGTSNTATVGPMPDDRWYGQALYGVGVAKVSATANPDGTVTLTITKASAAATGTNSTDTFDSSASTSQGGPGNGTGSQTQNGVLRYILERKAPGEGSFTALNSNVTDSGGSQNADPTVNHSANSFTFTDSTITQAGTHTYRVRAVFENTGEDSINSEEASADVGTPPDPNTGPATITSALSATGTTNVAFSYTLTANGTAPITLNATNLPSFLTFSGDTISGTPTATGTFNITLTASNAEGTDTQTLVLTVSDTPPGTLTVSKLIVKLNFRVANKDKFILQGTVSLTSGFDPTGAAVTVDVGGASINATLDLKGRAKSANLVMKLKERNGVFLFKAISKNNSHQSDLSDDGLTNADNTGSTESLAATVTIAGQIFPATVSVFYKSKLDKKGSAKNQ